MEQIKRTLHFTWRGRDYFAVKLENEDAEVSGEYLVLGDGWRVDAPTVGDRVELAGISEPWDGAVPQEWHDANRGEIEQRGGFVIWHYPPGNLFGQPVFADEINRLAAETCASMIAEQL